MCKHLSENGTTAIEYKYDSADQKNYYRCSLCNEEWAYWEYYRAFTRPEHKSIAQMEDEWEDQMGNFRYRY